MHMVATSTGHTMYLNVTKVAYPLEATILHKNAYGGNFYRPFNVLKWD